MPSPFPGIDPYLESQGYWPDYHTRFMTYCCDAISDHLPESYEARLGEQLRLVELIEPHAKTALPDVAVVQSGEIRGDTGAATAGVLTKEPLLINLPTEEMEEVRDVWIEIRRRPDRRLVTAIEILSPTNKVGEGYWEYRAKRRKLIRQKVHLVELDMLVGGRRLEMDPELPPADFYAFVSRAELRPKSEVYAWSIRQPVPRIPIPLLAPDPDIILDLPSLFALGYERGRYARALDYAAPLDLPLAPADRTWAEELAKQTRA
jgi:Protein of unknown function (DUF4058)